MPLLTATVVSVYIILLLIIARVTSKKNDNQTFFTANRTSPWFLVAFGMIGTSISGVTFISIPGQVNAIAFSYFQIVIGYFFGYVVVIAISCFRYTTGYSLLPYILTWKAVSARVPIKQGHFIFCFRGL